jgi:hypothetical protein
LRVTALDTAVLGDTSRDLHSRDIPTRVRASRFLKSLAAQGVVPLLCWHHLEELLGHDDLTVAQNRFRFPQSLPVVAWVSCYDLPDQMGSIVDVLAYEAEERTAIPSWIPWVYATRSGKTVSRDRILDNLLVNGLWTLSVSVVRAYSHRLGPRWTLRIREKVAGDFVLLVRMNPGNDAIKDNYLVPHSDLAVIPGFICPSAPSILKYPLDSLETLYRRGRAPQ